MQKSYNCIYFEKKKAKKPKILSIRTCWSSGLNVDIFGSGVSSKKSTWKKNTWISSFTVLKKRKYCQHFHAISDIVMIEDLDNNHSDRQTNKDEHTHKQSYVILRKRCHSGKMMSSLENSWKMVLSCEIDVQPTKGEMNHENQKYTTEEKYEVQDIFRCKIERLFAEHICLF